MRVYHLLSTKWGLESIQRRRLRISRFADLNDPFELLGANLRDKPGRYAFREWKREISQRFGLLCFSKRWDSPLLWSHYADRHRGMCLGFDVPDQKAISVRYKDDRIEASLESLNEISVMEFLTTKYVDWAYEQEVRIITDLSENDPDDDNYYADFGDEIELKEVIVGALSTLTRNDIAEAMDFAGLVGSEVDLIKARLAFKSFAIVRDKRGLAVRAG